MLEEERNKRAARIIIFVLLFTMIAWLMPGNLPEAQAADAAAKKAETKTVLHNPKIDAKTGKVTWDCVYFGHYPQSHDGKGGFKNDRIKWRVLSVEGNDAFLLAEKNLDVKPYNQEDFPVPWENCTLRSWLNDTFLNKAFNAAEQNAILQTDVSNADNPEYGTPGGNDTQDKVYLLSIAEAMNSDYGFSASNYDTKTRKAMNTAYAANCDPNMCEEGEYMPWWLRSSGEDSRSAASVGCYGFLTTSGLNVAQYGIEAIRPVLHLNLSSNLWSYAKTVEMQCKKQTINVGNFNKVDGDKPFYLNVKAKGKLSYWCEVDFVRINGKTGQATMKDLGIAPVLIEAKETAEYEPAFKKIYIYIHPKKMAAPTVSSPKAGTLKVNWKKYSKAKGYQVTIATNSSFTKNKQTFTSASVGTLSKTFTGLKKRTTYYVKVRAYVKDFENDVQKTLYGKYSTVKKIRTR